jgi:ATP-binding cassette, subfamily B, bacterial
MEGRAEQRPANRKLRKKRAVKVKAINLWENSWPVARAADAIQSLSFRVGLACKAMQAPQAPVEVMEGDADASRAWVSALVQQCGLRGESKQASYSAMPELLGAGPSLLQVNFEKGARVLAIHGLEAALGGWIGEENGARLGNGEIEIISPDGGVIRTTVANLRTALANELERKISEDVAPLFGELSIENNCRQEILRQVYEKRLGEERIAEVWKLDVPISAGITEHARRAGAWRHLAAFLATYGIEYGLWIVSWVLVGRWALEGRLDTGWLVAWALLLLTIIPIHMMSRWEQTKFAVSGAAVVMRQLLEGTFKLLPEEVRYGGVGQMIAQVLDSQALQSLALSGAITGLVAIFEITASAVLLATVAKSGVSALLLVIWAGLSAALAFAFHQRRHEWTDARLDMTGDLVERMVGHRTRVVQQERQFWHDGEDAELCSYVEKSKRMDRLGIIFVAVVPRGWLLVGIAAIAPGFIYATQSTGILAAQLGAVMLAYGALQKLSLALADISGAEIAWEHSRDLLVAADRTEAAGDPAIAVAANAAPSGRLLEMRNVTYRYPRRNADAVQRAFVEIEPGDRILLHG